MDREKLAEEINFLKCEHVHKDAPEGAKCEDCYGRNNR